MSNVLMITPPEKQELMEAGDRPNLGVHYLAANLRKHGHVPIISDLNHDSYNNMESKIEEGNVDFIGMTTVTPYYDWVTEFAKHLKQNHPNIPLIAGGPHATVDPYSLTPFFDYVVMGEGEQAIVDIVEGQNGKIITNPFNKNLDELPNPHLEIDYSLYGLFQDGELTATLQASRSCNFNCCFCTKDILGPTNRKFSLDKVIGEIDYLQYTKGINSFYFLDDSFTLNKKRATEFGEKVIERDDPITYRVGSRTDAVNPRLLDVMKESGLRSMSFGLEHWDDNVLKLMNKKNNIANHQNAIELCKERDIKVRGSFIVNLPGATNKTIQKTMDMAMELNLDYADFYPLIAYPGAPIWKNPDKFGIKIIDKSYNFHQTRWKTNVDIGTIKPERANELVSICREQWAKWKGKACPWESK